MNTITTSTPHAMSPEALTVAIRHEHEAVSTAARSALEHALEAGRLLAEAKATIPHGSWEAYVKDVCGIAPRTARLYQRLHRHRDRIPNRQHVADLSVRQAARLLETPKAKSETVAAGDRWDYLGQHWAEMTCTGCKFNPEWLLIPCPMYADGEHVPNPGPAPEWYEAGHRHVAQHPSGWFWEVTPFHAVGDRVNVIAHDPTGTLHLASFDGTSPEGLSPFFTACERHHSMPAVGDEWTITPSPVPITAIRLAKPFPLEIFDLAARPGHRCCCWVLIDEAIGRVAIADNPGSRAWRMFGDALGMLAKAGLL